MLGRMQAVRTAQKRFSSDALEVHSDDTIAVSEDSEDDSRSQQSRTSSPKSAMDVTAMFGPAYRPQHRTVPIIDYSREGGPDAERRVTIWNWREGRKLSGNSAPFKKNLHEYLRNKPDWEEYVGQDKAPGSKRPHHQHNSNKRRRLAHEEGVMVKPRPRASNRGARGSRVLGRPVWGARQAGVVLPEEQVDRHLPLFDEEAQREAAAKKAQEDARRQKEHEEKEARRWRDFSAIQHIIDHYNTGPSRSSSPFSSLSDEVA